MNESETNAKAPVGYEPCHQKCGRWTNKFSAYQCWHCHSGGKHSGQRERFPDWLPPPPSPPSPAVNVERRAGQRWRCDDRHGRLDGTLESRNDGGWALRDVETTDGLGVAERWFGDSRWTLHADTMALLADAPAVPAKAVPVNPALDAAWYARHPPAQEAPKVAACSGSLHACGGPVLTRVVGAIKGAMCESWMFRLEGVIQRATSATGTPYTGASRLPRPALACDYVWDLLPDSDR